MISATTPRLRILLVLTLGLLAGGRDGAAEEHRYLYAATPGIRNYLEYGGHGLVVFDIDNNHKFIKRIPTAGLGPNRTPDNVKGVCASPATNLIHISTIRTLTCLDLFGEAILWEKAYEGGCDRMALSPDGKTIYLPTLEKDHWKVVDAKTGNELARVVTDSGSHNTIYGLDGKHAYLAGLRSPLLTVTDTANHKVAKTVGPFAAPIRPFTINGKGTLCYVNINGLLGFEVGDIATGQKLHRVEVQGYEQGEIKRHGCPSHGVGLTPDEAEVWVVDAHNQSVHVFDNTAMPPRQVESIKVRDEPGWITFSLDGRFAYPSTGDVIDVKTRKIVATLTDENGTPLQSEKMVEIHKDGDRIVRTGDQFGLGRVR